MTHYVGDSCPGGHQVERGASGVLPDLAPRLQEELERMNELAAHKDTGKPLVADIDPEHLLDIGTVLAASVGKYPNDPDGTPNWYKGGSHRGFAASALRHILADLRGEEIDPESGLPHLDHASTDLMFLRSWRRRGVGNDDRLRPKQTGITGIPLVSEPVKHRVQRSRLDPALQETVDKIMREHHDSPPLVDRSIPPMGD